MTASRPNRGVYPLAKPALICLFTVAQCIVMRATAATPPDFTGVWKHARIRGEGEYDKIDDTSFMKPWTLAEVTRREKAAESGNPVPSNNQLCLPAGVPNILQLGHDLQIVQTSHEVLFLAESDHQVLRVRLNARHSPNLKPSWYGDSVGQWKGNTLIVDTIGLNDKTQISSIGTPHSELLHVVQRFHLQNGGARIEDQVTLEDPLAFDKPWVYYRHFDKSDRGALSEYACAENNQDDSPAAN